MTADKTKQILDNLAFAAGSQKIFIESFEELPERTRGILVMRYGLDGEKSRTLEECGRPYRISVERVRQIIAKGIRQINKGIRFKVKMVKIQQSFD